MKNMFYQFTQNNSGGYFHEDPSKGIGRYIIIEAESEDDAIIRAESIGLYFDGSGDCPCCGNRWSSYIEGDEFPEVYGQRYMPTDGQSDTFIHFLDGSFTCAVEYDED